MSALGTTRIALDRIGRWNGRLAAFATLMPEQAMEQARHLDAMAALGMPRGPLFGMPMAVKDIIDVAGVPTRGGSRTRVDALPAPADATVVARLRAAGAVFVGKANTVEYAYGGWGTNFAVGTPHNPWDLDQPRVPGGSSSGSAVAVAAGLVPAALGSDTGGSIRLPASFCGIVGLKTTWGLIPARGVLPLAERFDTVGPLARSVADAANVFLALLDEGETRLHRITTLRDDIGAVLAGGVAGLRIGVLAAPEVALHADTGRVFDETQALLAQLGATLIPVRLPRALPDYMPGGNITMGVSAYRHYAHLAQADPCLLGDPVRRRILAGGAVAAHTQLTEFARREREMADVAALFGDVDAILSPATAEPAPRLDAYDEDNSPAIFTRFANYYDLAGLALPMGRSAEGLPVGMMLTVAGFHEATALRIGAALEVARQDDMLSPAALAD